MVHEFSFNNNNLLKVYGLPEDYINFLIREYNFNKEQI